VSVTPPLVAGAHIEFYRLTELIDKGGFSEIWSAWDERLKRVVALKVVFRTGADAQLTIQFRREATIVARLEHPHILPLYDFGERPEYRFLVMRYLTGGSLSQRIAKRRLSVPEILRLMMPVAETLDYIHDQRIVHRDLKPANILLDAQDEPYLSDFGLAKSLGDTTTPMHSTSGTLTYMPPEQFLGGVLSPRSDQFSFGIMLYQLFTGVLPYKGEFAVGMRQLKSGESLPDATLANPELPADLNEYLRQLTRQEPEARPESAAAVMKMITALFRGTSDDIGIATTPSLSLALESTAYRQHEAESLLHNSLAAWKNDHFALSLTHYALLNVLLRDLETLQTPDTRSLMIRGALEYNLPDEWWKDSSPEAQQRACWNAVRTGSDPVRLKAIDLAVTMPWGHQAPPDVLKLAGQRLMPITGFTASALSLLEKALPSQQAWPCMPDAGLAELDGNLRALATSNPTDPVYMGLPARAAALIGKARRTGAALGLPTSLALLTIYEQAGSLPEGIPIFQQLKVALALALHQLTRRPLQAVQRYSWAATGNILAYAALILTIGWPRFLDFNQLLNHTIAYGLLYGLILGLGVWLSQHIGSRLRVLPYLPRTVLGALAGGLVVAAAFTLYNQIALDNAIDPLIALYSGVLYVSGFAIGEGLALWATSLLGAGGIALALLIPWFSYLQNESAPPLDFGDLDTSVIVILVGGVALLATILTLGYRLKFRRVLTLLRARPAPYK
jgi:serine/threonine protein kinase